MRFMEFVRTVPRFLALALVLVFVPLGNARAENYDAGRILHVDSKAGMLVLTKGKPKVAYRFRVSATVTVNGKPAKPADLLPGMDVQISTFEPGIANSIAATAPLAPAAGPGEKAKALIDPNTASFEELDDLPGIGPATAAAIEDGRPYSRLEDLMKVKGIGVKTLVKIAPFLRFEKPAKD